MGMTMARARFATGMTLLLLYGCGGSTPPPEPSVQPATVEPETTPEPTPAEPEPAPAPTHLLTKPPKELTSDDFASAFEKLGYELKSFAASGRYTTVLGAAGEERCTVSLWEVKEDVLEVEKKRLTDEQGAVAVKDNFILGVRLDPPDAAKAEELLAKLFGAS